jgi:hypothetical protein
MRFPKALALTVLILAPSAAVGDVISDWNEKAVAYVVGRGMGPPPAERTVAMMHLAMFDALNSIERKYQPYLLQLHANAHASKEAAAAMAAGTVLAAVSPQTEQEVKAALQKYLAAIPEGESKAEGVKLGEAVALKIIEARAGDGAGAPDTYRPKTPAGVYVPTPKMFVPHWPAVKPFAMTEPAQFRPPPPIGLESAQWATDYNEIKGLGRIDSTSRTADQTQAAKFWLAIGGDVYYPLVRSVALNRKLDLIESARLMALVAVARADSLLAVFEAKYHYNFWRPITAIRNGDNDGNPATERDASWQPIADTPMHPEYPCAHCVQAASMCALLEKVLGTHEITEIAMTSTTAPGITRRWSNLHAFVQEVSDARVWAGFHYRFSTKIGQDLGQKIGEHVVGHLMQPVPVAAR